MINKMNVKQASECEIKKNLLCQLSALPGICQKPLRVGILCNIVWPIISRKTHALDIKRDKQLKSLIATNEMHSKRKSFQQIPEKFNDEFRVWIIVQSRWSVRFEIKRAKRVYCDGLAEIKTKVFTENYLTS